MEETYLSAGEFAKLARTTKRTVLWYAEKNILKPYKTNENGYRLYRPQQIIDLQVILLLRKLNFSLEEVKQYIERERSLEGLLALKKRLLKQELRSLKQALHDTEEFYDNLLDVGVFVHPEVKDIPAFAIYYIHKTGPYAKIGQYCQELAGHFAVLPKNVTYLTIFEDNTYTPHSARMRIGIIAKPGLKLLSPTNVMEQTIPAYTALVCHHRGSGALLSLLWQELGKYRNQHGLKSAQHLDFADLEIYTEASRHKSDDAMVTEMHMPIAHR